MNIVILAGILVTLITAIPVFHQLRRHPKGLVVLFFAEMWERFSFYGMRALLIFYLTGHFLFSDRQANTQYASYTSLVYLLPLIGGLMADRYLGTRKAIVFGAILLVLGHGSLAFEGKPHIATLTWQDQTYEFVRENSHNAARKLQVGDGVHDVIPAKDGGIEIVGLPAEAPLPAILPAGSYTQGVIKVTPWGESVFFLSLSLIILGVGYLKANISSLVGQIYPEKDPRRDSGFTLYYYGINLGAFWAAVLCGLLGETWGWGWGFGLAGLGMLAGLIVFVRGKPLLEGKGEPPAPERLRARIFGLVSRETLIYSLSILSLPLIWFLVQRNSLVGSSLLIASLAVIGYVVWNMIRHFTRRENYRLGMAFILIFASVAFFTLFEQAGSSLNLFAARNTNLQLLSQPIVWSVFGHPMALGTPAQIAALGLPEGTWYINTSLTASQTQSFNAGFILLFAPVFAGLFVWLGRIRRDPHPLKKFAFALVSAGLGFLVLVWAEGFADSHFRLPLIFLMLTYMFHTWGELALSPVGLSQITRLTPPVIVSTVMAIWFLGTSAAQYVAGFIAATTATDTVGGQVLDQELSLNNALTTFNIIGWWGVGLGVGLFALSFLVRHWDRD